eukprot:3544137-Amphidinium_carterae.1
MTVVTLLPKPDGGVRPIGLSASPFRLWSRARALEVAAIEDSFTEPEHVSDALSAGLVHGVEVEAALATRQLGVAVMLDISKCYEHIGHRGMAAVAA